MMHTSLVPAVPGELRQAFATARERAQYASCERRRSKLVLCVDDDMNIRDIVRYSLGEAGYPVLVCRDGLTSLSLLARFEPCLILLDVEMPELNGFELLKEIRERFQTLRAKVIFLTGRQGLEDVRAAQNLGADDYLIKPFTRGNLVRRLDRWCGV